MVKTRGVWVQGKHLRKDVTKVSIYAEIKTEYANLMWGTTKLFTLMFLTLS